MSLTSNLPWCNYGMLANTKYTISRAGNNRRRSSRVSVVATTRSTNSGGSALVNAPTDTRGYVMGGTAPEHQLGNPIPAPWSGR